MNTTGSLSIHTTIQRDWECRHLMTFTVRCTDATGALAGSLQGFMLDIGDYPEPEEMLDATFFLDGRSDHALEAFEVLGEYKPKVEAMFADTNISTFIHLEEAKVERRYRGHGLALRLMREVRFMLRGYGRIVTLKAHPLEGEANPDQQKRLAAYYQSDTYLELRPVDEAQRPGWLVASWDEPKASRADERTWAPRG